MFTQEPSVNEAKLDEIINKLLLELEELTSDTTDHKMLTERLAELYKLKTADSEITSRKRVSPDVIVSSIASLLGILAILGHERTHIVTTKAFSLLTRLR